MYRSRPRRHPIRLPRFWYVYCIRGTGQHLLTVPAASYSSKTQYYAPATGGADGSLLLSSVEITRDENNGLQSYYGFLQEKYSKYKSQVGAADLVQFAASVAIVSCPGGPKVPTVWERNFCFTDYSD